MQKKNVKEEKLEDKNEKLEINKARKQIRTGVQAGGWRISYS